MASIFQQLDNPNVYDEYASEFVDLLRFHAYTAGPILIKFGRAIDGTLDTFIGYT